MKFAMKRYLVSKKNIKYYYANAPYIRPLVSVLLIYIMLAYLLTLNPYTFSKFYAHQFLQFHRGYLTAFIGGASVEDVLLNLFMLLPFGGVLGLIMRLHAMKPKSAIIIATASGFLISFSIEFCQLFLPRTTSGVDLITNTIGAAAGAWLAYPIGKYDLQQLINILYNKDQAFYKRVIGVYVMFATMVLFIPLCLNTFRNWDSDFHLLVGNEATQNRPWNGNIYKMAIYNQALNDQAIESLSRNDYRQISPEQSTKGLIGEYLFNDIQPKMIDESGDQLQLIAPESYQERRQERDGFMVKNNIFFKSTSPASHVIEPLKQTNQLTIAVWIKPENLNQAGPARIVSLSKDVDHRNFTLAQSGAMLNFRVRTPLTGLNGSEVQLLTNQAITAEKSQSIVATFHRGEHKLYVDGTRVTPIIFHTSYYLPLLINLGKNQFGKFAFCFILLFPMGWLARGLIHARILKSAVSSLIILIPFFILSLFTSMVLHLSFDLHLFYVCSLIAGFVLLIGLLYDLTFRGES